MGDEIDPMGVSTHSQRIPLLWNHRNDAPIGWATLDKPTKDGVGFVARIAKIAEGQVR